MEIAKSQNMALSSPLSKPVEKTVKEELPQEAQDNVTISATPADSPKACGTVGAAIGASLGKATLLPVFTAVKGAALLGSWLGPVGAVIGGVGGFGLGFLAETKLKPGRVLGGLVGGAIGMGVGKVLEKLHVAPSDRLAKETEGFQFKSLFKKLFNPKYTSHKKITAEQADEILKSLQPGDLIVGNNDQGFRFEITQKAIGASGEWTHVAIFADDHTVLEVMIPGLTDRGNAASGSRPYAESNPQELIQRNHHLMILRPNYKDRETINKVIETGRTFKNVEYDNWFNLNSDDRHYCTEFVYKVLQKAAPEIKLETSSFLGYKFITADNFFNSPDVQKVHDTGSEFWMNFLSKFD